jgi:hypothetical protein
MLNKLQHLRKDENSIIHILNFREAERLVDPDRQHQVLPFQKC